MQPGSYNPIDMPVGCSPRSCSSGVGVMGSGIVRCRDKRLCTNFSSCILCTFYTQPGWRKMRTNARQRTYAVCLRQAIAKHDAGEPACLSLSSIYKVVLHIWP